MEIEVESRKENKLLEREEIHFIVKYEKETPPRNKIKEELKNALGIGGFIVIHKIEPSFGIRKARVYAKVYPDEKTARKIEEEYLLKREKIISKKGEEKKEEEKNE